MSIFGKQASIEAGISRGSSAGQIGVWVKQLGNPQGETLQLLISAVSGNAASRLEPHSFTFLPSHKGSFWQSLEMPLSVKEFLTGLSRAGDGSFTFQFRFSDNSLSQTYEVAHVLKVFRGKGPGIPDGVTVAKAVLEADSPFIGSLTISDLKKKSDEKRKELEEAKKKFAEELKAKETAKKKAAEDAAKKAAAASAPAAAKPAGPTISGGKAALFFGSTTNNTADVAAMLKEILGPSIDHVVNVASCHPQDFTVCPNLILGVPTWHIGEMQDDWATILPALREQKYDGKKIAIFGLGDQKGYPETYVDAMGELLEIFEPRGAKLVGLWPTTGYDFKKSKGIRDGKFMGLVVDVENQSDKTPARVKAWAEQIRKELGI